MEDNIMLWKVHVANLLQEVIEHNESTWILHKPMLILGKILHEVGVRASEINDPELNALMCRLAIYEVSDPTQPGFDARKTEEIIKKGVQTKNSKSKL